MVIGNVKERQVDALLCTFCEHRRSRSSVKQIRLRHISLEFVCDDISRSRDLDTWLAGTLDNSKLRSGYNDHLDPQACVQRVE